MALSFIYVLIGAFILDLLLGDPRWLPHLIVGYGKLISLGEKKLNQGIQKYYKGAFLTVTLVSSAFVVPAVVLLLLKNSLIPYAEIALSIVMLFYCLANRTLVKEGLAVFRTLDEKGLEEGRKRLSWIVGRDTSTLNEQQIKVATFETMSENLSDGVIAPLFYFVCFGLPGAMAYKMVNTLDSMIGYRNERYEQFGKFAAILDDIANYIPARITALLMLIVGLKPFGLKQVFREGKKHSSPNAGFPEAALAHLLSCQFGGPNLYEGKLFKKPYIGTNDRLIDHKEIYKVSMINYAASSLFVLLSCLIFFASH